MVRNSHFKEIAFLAVSFFFPVFMQVYSLSICETNISPYDILLHFLKYKLPR